MRRTLVVCCVLATCLSAVAATARAADGASPRAKQRYESQLKLVGPDLGYVLRTVAAVHALAVHRPAKPTAARTAAAKLEPLSALLRTTQRRLRSIAAPGAARAPHASLVRGAGELASELGPLVERLRRGYLVAATDLDKLAGAVALRTGTATLEKQGYRFGVGRL